MAETRIGWMTGLQMGAAIGFGVTGVPGYLVLALLFAREGRLLFAAASVTAAAVMGCLAVLMLKRAQSYHPEM